jgi:hypothetical protein
VLAVWNLVSAIGRVTVTNVAEKRAVFAEHSSHLTKHLDHLGDIKLRSWL